MLHLKRRPTFFTVMTSAILSSIVLAGCGGSTVASGQPTKTNADVPGTNKAAVALLPDAIRKSGTLRIATSLQWPPFGYKGKDGNPTGVDIEMTAEIAKRLGLKPEATDVQFPSLVPGVATGRFDIAVDELADTAERRTKVQFVDYYETNLALLVKKGTTGITPDQLCGHTLAVTQASSQVTIAEAISADCVAKGNKPITFVTLPESAQTILAVSSGRAEGFLTDSAVGTYMSLNTNTDLEVTPGQVAGPRQRAGIVVGKDNNELAKAVQVALQSMIDDGAYGQIFDKFHIPKDTQVAKATINDGQS